MSQFTAHGNSTRISTSTLFVNLSAQEFESADFFEVVLEIMPADYATETYRVTKKIRLNSRDISRLGL